MRRHELDGLRAVGATMVVLYHSLVSVAGSHELTADLHLGPAGALANGPSAVVLFFVLSGYVLTGSFLRDPGPSGTLSFLGRRALRLYPAWIVALAVTWLVSFAYPELPSGAGLSASMQKSLGVHLGLGDLLHSLAVPGVAGGQLPQGWSLRLELQLSILLPAFVAVVLRWRPASLLAVVAVGLVLSERLLVLHAFPFALGIGLARCAIEPARWSRGWLAGAGALAVAAFFLPPGWLWPVSPALGVAVASAGAAGLVLFVLHVPGLRRALSAPMLVWTGERSYGLYLLHFAVVCLVAPFVVGDEPAGDRATAITRWLTLASIVLPVSLVLALASWRWVERPAIGWGRRVTRRLEAGRPAA